jgi:hypothetical protein
MYYLGYTHSFPSVACAALQGALHAAHQNTKVPGSATACVIQLDQERRTLEAANLVSESVSDQVQGKARSAHWRVGGADLQQWRIHVCG